MYRLGVTVLLSTGLGTHQMLWRAQDVHPRNGLPGAFLAGGCRIDRQDPGHLLSHQIRKDRYAGLTGPDHKHIEDFRSVICYSRNHPGIPGIVEHRALLFGRLEQSIDGRLLQGLRIDGIW